MILLILIMKFNNFSKYIFTFLIIGIFSFSSIFYLWFNFNTSNVNSNIPIEINIDRKEKGIQNITGIDSTYIWDHDNLQPKDGITDANIVRENIQYKISSLQGIKEKNSPTINSVFIKEESIANTTATLEYSINIPDNIVITKIEVTNGSKVFGSIKNDSNDINANGTIELSNLKSGKSYSDLYIVIYAIEETSGNEIIVNNDDSIKEGHIGEFKLINSSKSLYISLSILIGGVILALIIGFIWYSIRKRKTMSFS